MTKPRLLVLINNFPPDRGGAAAVYGDMCQGLAERVEQGVRVERYGLYIPANPNSTLRRFCFWMDVRPV